MLNKVVLILIAAVCVGLGLLGIVLPFLPGIVFFLIALACCATLLPGLRRFGRRRPRLARFYQRLDAGEALTLPEQLKLMLWASLEVISPGNRNRSA